MLVTVTKEKKFSASHQLPHHKGKCHNLHGHTFVVQVSLTGPIQPEEEGNSESGMVCDFARFGAFLTDLHDTVLDHKHLNDTLDHCPTAERLVRAIAEMAKHDLEPCLPEGVWVSRVRLYEEYVTPQCYAEASFPGRGLGQ